MPEFQRQRHRSLTDEQLYEEYHRTEESKKKSKSASAAKKVKRPAAAGKSPSSRREQPKKQEERRHDPPPKKKAQMNLTSSKKRSVPPKKKSVTSEKKSAPPKKKPSARKKRGKMTLYYVLIGIVAVTAVSILSVTVLFNISSFQVVGKTSYSDEEIIAACGIEEGDNLLRINIGGAEKQIVSKLVYIDSARINRGFPNRLVINVEPAHPALSFAADGRFYVISERGRLLEIGRVSADCPVVKGFAPDKDAVIGLQLEDDDDGRINIALQMIDYMQQYGLNAYCEINLADTLNIRLNYDNRIEMELGASTRLEDKIYHAGLLVNDEISPSERCILILSNPDRVVKRPVYESIDDDDISEEPQDDPPDDDPTDGNPGEGDPEGTGDHDNSEEPE